MNNVYGLIYSKFIFLVAHQNQFDKQYPVFQALKSEMEDGIFDSPTPQFHQDSNTSFLMEVRPKI